MVYDLFQIALVVDDYDKAIKFYTEVLHFDLLEDTVLSPVKRWVRVRPKGSNGASLLLAKAKNEQEAQAIGNQTGGRVFLFMHTDDLVRDFLHLKSHHVEIVRPISEHEYGKVFVFRDIFGNLWDVIQPPN